MNARTEIQKRSVADLKAKARRFADPGCNKCHGTGNVGTLWPMDGSRPTVLICECAAEGFPDLFTEERGYRYA